MFRRMPPDADLLWEVHRQTQSLAKRHASITRCDVAIELPKRRSAAKRYSVRIEVIVPGGPIVVNRTDTRHAARPNVNSLRLHARREYDADQADCRALIRDAFAITRRKLQTLSNIRADRRRSFLGDRVVPLRRQALVAR